MLEPENDIKKHKKRKRGHFGNMPFQAYCSGKISYMSIYSTDRIARKPISVQSIPMKHCTEYGA